MLYMQTLVLSNCMNYYYLITMIYSILDKNKGKNNQFALGAGTL